MLSLHPCADTILCYWHSPILNGDVNTATTIRTAHVRDGLLSFSAGATLLCESVPESELKETRIKAGVLGAAEELLKS